MGTLKRAEHNPCVLARPFICSNVYFAVFSIRFRIDPALLAASNVSGATVSGASARWSLMTRKCGQWQWERQAAWVLVLRLMVREIVSKGVLRIGKIITSTIKPALTYTSNPFFTVIF